MKTQHSRLMTTASRLSMTIFLGIGLFAAAPSRAQTAQQAADPQSTSTIDDVVVTASRRSSTVQNTASVVEALSAEDIAKTGTSDTSNLQNVVPGLTFTSSNNGQTLIYIRGIGTSILGLAAGASVSTYVDGVYLSNQLQGTQKFNVIERIEVLKGPQATLYGRNATGGVINIITREPSAVPSFDADISAGNYGAYTLRASVGGPVHENVSALVSMLYDTHDGYNTNVVTGDDLGEDSTRGLRGALRFDLSGTSSLTMRADYTDRAFSDYLKDVNPGSFLYILAPGGSDYLADPRSIKNNIKNGSTSQDGGLAVTYRKAFSFGDLTSVTSYRVFESGPNFLDIDGNDGSVLPASLAGPNGYAQQIFGDTANSNQVYHETYLSTDRHARFFGTVGANYHQENADAFIYRPQTYLFGDPGSTSQTYARRLEDDTWSVFADLGWNLTDKLTLTGGARYSKDDKSYSQNAIAPGAGIPAGVLSGHRVDESTSPRIGLEYRPKPGLLVYATATSGFKSGGFSENDPRNTFNPETIVSYESGFKSTFLDRRVKLNGSAFYSDYKDLQIQQILPDLSRIIVNADGATVYGVDFEAEAVLADGLSMSLNGEYLDTEIGDATLCSPLGPCSAPPNNGGIRNVNGSPLPNAPKWSLIAAADYEFAAGPGRVSLHADASYRSLVYFNYFGMANLPNGVSTGQDAHTILNAQVRYEAPSGWSATVFGRNLGDETVASLKDVIYASGTTVVTARYAAPRTYGVTFGVSF